MDDATIIQKILSRDRKALAEFYHTYQHRLLVHIQQKISNTHDAEEILQDTLFAFLEAIRDFHGKAQLQTFLFSICNHKIIDYYRRKKLKQVVFSQMPRLEQLISPLLGPEEAFDAAVFKEKIHHVLNRLLPHYRQTLLLKYLDNLSVVDIAKKLSVSIKSAESILFRARKAFVELFVSI